MYNNLFIGRHNGPNGEIFTCQISGEQFTTYEAAAMHQREIMQNQSRQGDEARHPGGLTLEHWQNRYEAEQE